MKMPLLKGGWAQVARARIESFSFPKSPVVNASATDIVPNVVSGCDILVSRGKGKRRVRLASAWTSGEFDFDVFLRLPGGRTDVLYVVSSTRSRWGLQRCRRVHVPMCFAYTTCIHKYPTPGGLLQVHPLSVCTESVVVPCRSLRLWTVTRFRLEQGRR